MNVMGNFLLSILIVGGLFLIIGLLVAPKEINTVANPINELFVKGSAEQKVMPDNAVLNLQISVSANNASKAMTESNLIYSDIVKLSEGLQKDYNDITLSTNSFSVNPKFEWDYNLEKSIQVGYEAVQGLQLQIPDFNAKGDLLVNVIDEILKNKKVSLSYLSFELSDVKEKEIKDKLATESIQDALSKAKNLSEAGFFILNPTPIKVNLYGSDFSPYPIYNYKGGMMEAKSDLTNYTPEQQTLSVSVDVTYTYK